MPGQSLIVMRDSKEHAAQRKLFARAFSKTCLRQNTETSIQERTKKVVARIKRDAESNTANILKLWTLYAADISGHIIFGDSLQMWELGEVSDPSK